MDRVIDLPRLELGELVETVRDPEAAQAFGIYVVAFDHPAAELGRHLEREVFLEFFGNTPDLLRAEYDPYEQASLFFVCVDHRRNMPAGVLRVLVPTDAGSKSLADIERVWSQPLDQVVARTGLDWDVRSLWDVATLAVGRDYRGEATKGFVSFALYQALSIAVHRCSIDHVIAVLDVVVLDLIQAELDAPFAPFEGIDPKDYLDSPASLPVFSHVPRWAERVAVANPTLFELMCEGRGMEAAIAHPDWDRVAGEVERLTGRAVTPARPSLQAPG